MKFSDLLSPMCIDARLMSPTPERAIGELVDLLAVRRIVRDPDAVLDSILDQQRIWMNGVGNGFALPHARLADCTRPALALGRLQKPLDFGAWDGQPISMILLLISPADKPDLHVHMLANLAQLMNNAAFRADLGKAPNAGALDTLLRDRELSTDLYRLIV